MAEESFKEYGKEEAIGLLFEGTGFKKADKSSFEATASIRPSFVLDSASMLMPRRRKMEKKSRWKLFSFFKWMS